MSLWMLTSVSMTFGGWAALKQPAVYILANARNGTLYIGVTSDLIARVYQHRAGHFDGFTSRYDVKGLAWFETHETMETAIGREKQLKNWRRSWKIKMIEATNSMWCDLAIDLGFDPLP